MEELPTLPLLKNPQKPSYNKIERRKEVDLPAKKGDAYKRMQARNKARRDAFALQTPNDETLVSLLPTLTAYVLEAINDNIKEGLHFRYARVKEVIVRTRRGDLREFEIRNRGRSYTIRIVDNGPITGISPSDFKEYGGPDPMDAEDHDGSDEGDGQGGDNDADEWDNRDDDGAEEELEDCPNPMCSGRCNVCGFKD